MKDETLDYLQQAQKFLRDTSTTLEIHQVPSYMQESPDWAQDSKHGLMYVCILQNKKGKYKFNFWDSIANKEALKISNPGTAKKYRPNAYSVLACMDTYTHDMSFKEFCDSFGYDDDSISAQKTYTACLAQANELIKLFTTKELEKLAEIQ